LGVSFLQLIVRIKIENTGFFLYLSMYRLIERQAQKYD
jgi:hypothetical protein